ncbi:hypothetical protein ONE63_011093 [Megalurothrips usitatus]|uniref:ATP-dependent DNA helicase n=1 Tax=Megalurothrips usitatus TaxID=439358 RepID=A0AAV7XG01_9NEOP|nr:hypothetical protein ONE63_011093 [Megalurothrips usitatus]
MDRLSAIEVEDQDCNEDDSIEGELTKPHISEGCVPLNISSNQNEQVKRKLDDVTNESDQDVLNWPPLSKEPLNEFNTPGYICQAFPCLFPYGKADLRDNRQTKVSPSDYFKHLLRYEDNRFAQHTRFRFFAMNSLMRWSGIEKGNLYVNKHSDMKNMNVEELKEKVKENPSLVDSIMFQCSNVRGSKTYWKSKSKELLEMIEQLGMPTVFFTVSAADFHWPGLFKLLCPEEDLSTISEKKRADLIIEYQHRGSPHVHGLLWLKNAPDITDLSKKSDEDIGKIIEYFDTLISSTNPNVNAPPAVIHPCRIELEDIIDLKKDLAELLNRVQRHTKCTEGYCIKNTGCRFKFPKEMREFSEIQFKGNGEPEFVPKRNDERLNKYNPYIILLWRANMDIAPVLSKQALVNYLAKYVSKHEVKSQSMQEVFKEVCESSNSNAKNAIQKLYIKACSDRDFSAQEVGHIIMSEKLVSCSRSFVSLYLPKEENWVPLNENARNSKSLVQKYSERNQQLYGNKSLWYMTTWFDFQHKRIRSNHVIVVVFPKIKFKENQDRNEGFYRMKVLLHVPWNSMNQFENESWEQLYKDNIDVIKKEESDYVNNLGGIDIDVEEVLNDDDFENGDAPYRTTTEDHMIISSMLPGQNVAAPEIGRRYLDTINGWNSSIQSYPNYTIEELQNFLASNKANFQNVAEIPHYPNVQFNIDQMTVITLIEEHITEITNAEKCAIHLPKSVVVQGPAGTGKSLVIRAVTNRIMTALGVNSILLLAPTGVAAVNIGGSTIHSKLHISNIYDFEDLRNEAARKFCNEMKDVIVIDEYSMVGCAMMAAIDRRLKQSTGNYDALFGGYIVLFFGDVYQLPPVKDTPLYSEVIPQNPAKLHGKFVFSEIESAIFLRKVHRQSDPQFQSVLDRISRGKVIQDDYTYLKSRFLLNVSSDERKDFKDAIRLFPTKPLVQKHNIDYLTSLRHCVTNEPVPIAIIPAKHNCPKAESGSIDDASGLSSSLVLGLTCKIMLRCNLWTEQGLVNGAVGIIIDIIYRPEERPPFDMPAVLICKFEDYKGPFLNNDNEKKTGAYYSNVKIMDNKMWCILYKNKFSNSSCCSFYYT